MRALGWCVVVALWVGVLGCDPGTLNHIRRGEVTEPAWRTVQPPVAPEVEAPPPAEAPEVDEPADGPRKVPAAEEPVEVEGEPAEVEPEGDGEPSEVEPSSGGEGAEAPTPREVNPDAAPR